MRSIGRLTTKAIVSMVHSHLGHIVVSVGLLIGSCLIGCDAFEYYGPLPNLRHSLTVNLRELGKLQSLEIKRKSLSSDASKEVRLINTVNRVAIEDCDLADGRLLLESLGEIQRLESLTLRRCNLVDVDLAGLAAAENLHELEIVGTDIDGAGLAILTQLPIRSLTLHSKTATAKTLACLGEFACLEELSLNTPQLAINELPNLGRLKNLRSIKIFSGEFSRSDDMALRFLRDLPNLQEVFLSSESINDATMQALGQITTLERIELSRNGVTDLGIAELDSLPNLKALRIWDAKKLTVACLANIMKHRTLQEISLCGAPIHHSEAKQLYLLPNLGDLDVGMSHWECAEVLGTPHGVFESPDDEYGDGQYGDGSYAEGDYGDVDYGSSLANIFIAP